MPRTEADLVQVHNPGPQPVLSFDKATGAITVERRESRTVTLKWANREYPVPPKGNKLVPWPAMARILGDPDLVDHPTDRRRRPRTDEFRRLAGRYGVYENHDLFDDVRPNLEVYDVETGEKIITVADDPEGRHLRPVQQSMSEADELRATVDQMSRRLREQQDRLDAIERGEQAAARAEPAATDEKAVSPERADSTDAEPEAEAETAVTATGDVPDDTPESAPKRKSKSSGSSRS